MNLSVSVSILLQYCFFCYAIPYIGLLYSNFSLCFLEEVVFLMAKVFQCKGV